jgi:hypothetical protein
MANAATPAKKRGALGSIFGGAGRNFRFMVNEARRYGELRQTPYGLGPFFVVTVISFFGRFEGQAVSVASADIGQDLHLSVRDLIGLSSVVSVVGIGVGIFVAYYFDRHKRAPWVGIGTIVSGFAGMWTSQANGFAGVGTLQTLDQGATLAIETPLSSLTADYYPPEARGRVFALRGLTGPIIGVVAAATVGPDRQRRRARGVLCAVPLARARARLHGAPCDGRDRRIRARGRRPADDGRGLARAAQGANLAADVRGAGGRRSVEPCAWLVLPADAVAVLRPERD